MRTARRDENGNIIDVETGAIIVPGDGLGGDLGVGAAGAGKVSGKAAKPLKSPPVACQAPESGTAGRPSVKADDASSTSGASAASSPPLPSSRKLEKTKYDVTPDTHFVIRFGLIERDGIIRVVEDDDLADIERHWVRFRLWNFREENTWRVSCQEYSFESRSFIMNNNRFNELKIKNLMLDWSFAEFDDKYRLFHVGGILCDECYDLFCGLQTGIVFHIIRAMNFYLEQ